MEKYTMEDIEMFLDEYKKSQGIKLHNYLVSIPVVGKKLYEIAFLEEHKRIIFEKEYMSVINQSTEKQQEFIEKMTPVLDSYYGVDDKTIKMKK